MMRRQLQITKVPVLLTKSLCPLEHRPRTAVPIIAVYSNQSRPDDLRSPLRMLIANRIAVVLLLTQQ